MNATGSSNLRTVLILRTLLETSTAMNIRTTLFMTLLALASGRSLHIHAQVHTHDGVTPCGLNQAETRLFGLRPETREAAMAADRALEWETSQGIAAGSREDLLIIPVVFHVIHFNGPENISAAQVHDAVDVLNTNFRALNENIAEVIPEFQDITADVEIEFRLAQKDPSGNCHPGINRILSELTYVGDEDMKMLIQWPRNKYLNVWVCENAAGAAGYALYPGSVNGNQNADMDGIVLQHSYCGSIGTSNVYRSRTLTHEVGHWLNLRHTWGNSNNPGQPDNCDEDDNVDDTPNTLGWTSCVLDGTTCGSLDNVQNYMEYSYCGRMFTQGQKQRMRTAALSTTAQRNQLSTASNLVATGVAGEDILCQAVFTTDRQVICPGDSIRFTDGSYHGVTSWSWQFGDGQVHVGNDALEDTDVYHTYTTPGTYDVTLSVGNGTDMTSVTLEGAVHVLAPGAMDLPLSQGFEATEFPSDDWFVEDPLGDGTWELSSDASFTGSRALTISNWGNTVEFNDDFLRSSTMDMSEMTEIHISYKWAYAHKGTSEDDETDDRLRVSVTGDCGGDWDLRRMHRGFTDLPSADPTPFPFTPSSSEDWNTYTIVLDNEQYLTPHFRVQFEFESRLGNDIWLDDINVVGYGPSRVGDADASRVDSWTLSPNPATSEGSIQLDLRTPQRVTMIVRDSAGRVVDSRAVACSAGSNTLALDAPRSSGVYFVEAQTAQGERRVWQWVVQ
jgi:PKD repeat protein